jgi:ABC-2 type transport system permease protein
VVVVVLAVLASCAAWAGTAVSGKAADFGSTLKGGLNTVPLVLLFGGIALLVFGVVPRATSVMRFASVGLAYAIVFIGGAIKAPQWFLNVSPFTHLAPVPAAAADPEALIVMLCLAVLTGLAGAAAFAHRDTQVE